MCKDKISLLELFTHTDALVVIIKVNINVSIKQQCKVCDAQHYFSSRVSCSNEYKILEDIRVNPSHVFISSQVLLIEGL